MEPYVKRTYKDIKARETTYDPIVQKFRDPAVEQQIERAE